MFKFLLSIFKILLLPISDARREIFCVTCIVQKENLILKRSLSSQKRRVKLNFFDKLAYVLLYGLSGKIKEKIILIKPETVLVWYRRFLKKFWDFSKLKKKPGRPPVSSETRNLILDMKNNNPTWGVLRIAGELLKIGIELDKRTVARILEDFRRKGKIEKTLSWSRFLKSQWDSLFATDFFTVTTALGKTFYVLFIIKLKTRELVRMNVTDSPTRFFVKQQFMDWRWDKEGEIVHLIHDNGDAFKGIEYEDYGIKDVCTSYGSPNMNAYAERFVKSVRREVLDWFIIFRRQQLENILERYKNYYNACRPHQGLGQQIPNGVNSGKEGKVIAIPHLSGLHHHYERIAS